MLKIFIKIRQNLLSEGKTGKYLKYAIGEIVLLIIGYDLVADTTKFFADIQPISK